MAEKELKWYSVFVVLFGTILSIADPVTDILTVVEFYRADHKTWFGVGLTFIILPSFFFLLSNWFFETEEDDEDSEPEEGQSKAWKYTHITVLGCNPLFPAWLRLRTLFFYLKKLLKLRQVSNTNQTGEDLLEYSKIAVMTETALESAPQFIIQLYAMAVQQQSVTIVQIVSLPVSFLSLAWASTVVDEWIHTDVEHLIFSVKDRVLFFVIYLLILSSRLFAVGLFTVSYKWWVISVLIFHCTVLMILDTVSACKQRIFNCRSLPGSVFFSFFHWLRDNLALTGFDDENGRTKHIRRMQWISNVLFVIENIIMILLFYFSHFPHTWYSLPVTICVCLFAVLGAVMRLTYFHFSYKDSDDQSNNTDRVEQQSHSNLVEVAAT